MNGSVSALPALASLGLTTPDVAVTRADSAAWKASLGEAPVSGTPAKGVDMSVLARFEAVVLQNFIAAMLPEDAGSVYGTGLSGDMWKSILAQHRGEAVSDHGGIGIANRLLADQYRAGRDVVPLVGANDSEAKTSLATSTSLTTAMVQEFQRQATETLFTEGSITAGTDTSG